VREAKVGTNFVAHAGAETFTDTFHTVTVSQDPHDGTFTVVGALPGDPVATMEAEVAAQPFSLNGFFFNVYDDNGVDYSFSPSPVFVDLESNPQQGGFAQGDTLLFASNEGPLPGMFEIVGSPFDDTIRGGDLFTEIHSSGLIILDIFNNPGNQVLIGGAGSDVLEGRGGADILVGGTFTSDVSNDFASYESSPAAVTVRLAGVGPDTQTAIASGGDATGDILIGIEGLIGTRFNDTLTGNSLDNVLAGGLANDTLDGKGGIDTADYSRDHFYDIGDAADRVNVQLGLNGAAGTTAKFKLEVIPGTLTQAFVQRGTDQLISIENVTGTAGSDAIAGNELDNVLDGRGGDDLIDGGLGNDTIIGGGSSGDVASYQSHDSVPLLGLEQDTISLGINGADGSYTRSGLVGFTRRVVETDVLRGIAGVVGSNNSETINGNEFTNYFAGRGGNDTINGGAGNDTYDLSGPDNVSVGADRYFDDSGNDTVIINSLSDIVGSPVRDGNDLVVTLVNGSFRVVDHFNGHAIETLVTRDGKSVVLSTSLIGGNLPGIIVAGNGGETLDGRGGDDLLFGGNGPDRLIGGIGDDQLTGGNGADTFVFAPGFGRDVITDLSRADEIEFDGIFTNFKQVQGASRQVGADTVITVDTDNSITLQGVMLKDVRAEQFDFEPAAGAATTAGGANVPDVGLLGQQMASTFADGSAGPGDIPRHGPTIPSDQGLIAPPHSGS
jgi:Ca2+-binding RTX toxin-like protein